MDWIIKRHYGQHAEVVKRPTNVMNTDISFK